MLKVNIDIMLYKFSFNEIVETNERLYDKNFMTSYYTIPQLPAEIINEWLI